MPYITKEDQDKCSCKTGPTNAGELNYMIHQVIDEFLEKQPVNYQSLNDIIGVLECAKMELYRRIIAPYEDQKKEMNGDVEPYNRYDENK